MRKARGGVLLDFDGTLTKPVFDWPTMKREMALPSEATSILDYIRTAPIAQARRVAEILDRYEKDAAERAEANEGAHELVEFLRQREIPFGVVTNNTLRHVVPMLERTCLSIECLVTRDIGFWKPDPRHVLAGAKAIGMAPAKCVFIGDGLLDMIAARKAGMISVHLSSAPRVDWDHRLSHLKEAIPLLEHLLR